MADDSSEIVKEGAETAAFANIKTLGESTAFYTSLSMKQAVENQGALAAVMMALTSKAGENILNSSPEETAGSSAIIGQLAKLLQMTPPPTNLPTQGM